MVLTKEVNMAEKISILKLKKTRARRGMYQGGSLSLADQGEKNHWH